MYHIHMTRMCHFAEICYFYIFRVKNHELSYLNRLCSYNTLMFSHVSLPSS
jgi:hypothetical protein